MYKLYVASTIKVWGDIFILRKSITNLCIFALTMKSKFTYFAFLTLILIGACSRCQPKGNPVENGNIPNKSSTDSIPSTGVGQKWGFIDSSGRLVIEQKFDEADNFSEKLAAVKLNGKWGFINPKGELKIDTIYQAVWPFHNGLARALDDRGKIGFIDRLGRWAIRPDFENVTDFDEGKSIVETEKGYIYINSNGKKVINETFEQASAFEKGTAKVKLQGKYGILKSNEQWLISNKYQRINKQKNGFFLCFVGDKTVVVKSNGDHFNLPRGYNVLYFRPNAILVERNNALRILGDKNKVIVDSLYEEISAFADTLWQVRNGNMFGLISNSGKIVLPLQYQQIYQISENKIAFQKGDLWGFMDSSLRIMVQPTYKLAWSFKHGFARIVGYSGFGYINQFGKLSIADQFKDARDFSEGLARVQYK